MWLHSTMAVCSIWTLAVLMWSAKVCMARRMITLGFTLRAGDPVVIRFDIP